MSDEAARAYLAGVQEGLVAATRPRPPTTGAHTNVLVARCSNLTEPDGLPCLGRLWFTWGAPETPCDSCGARCGIAVAAWDRVIHRG